MLILEPRAAEAFPDRGLISVQNPKTSDNAPSKDFFFDAVYSPTVTQKHIYDSCAANVVESVLDGYNGTIFAYGQVIADSTWNFKLKCWQTGAGKVSSLFTDMFD